MDMNSKIYIVIDKFLTTGFLFVTTRFQLYNLWSIYVGIALEDREGEKMTTTECIFGGGHFLFSEGGDKSCDVLCVEDRMEDV